MGLQPEPNSHVFRDQPKARQGLFERYIQFLHSFLFTLNAEVKLFLFLLMKTTLHGEYKS